MSPPNNSAAIEHAAQAHLYGPEHHEGLGKAPKSLLYDYPWQHKEFSINKGDGKQSIHGYRDCWLWEQPDDHPIKKNVLAGWDMLKNNIKPEYFANQDYLMGIMGAITDYRYLGKI